jgi:pSer/pThr/pTyr-binding forkhead associated (FHA) protein
VDKLIIHHGDRVTEHELRAAPLTIGRDPECDLFFADKKLSRKHARVERVGAGFRLVDLESRNGSWVNEARVEARDLVPGDEIRLGGLRIQLEQDRDRDAGDESTVYLTSGAPPPPDAAGVVLVPDAPIAAVAAEESFPPTPTVTFSPDDSSTVFLPSSGSTPLAPLEKFSELDDADETLKRPEPERTVVLPGQLPGRLYDTGTVVFGGQADPSLQEAANRLAPPETQFLGEIELLDDEEPEASERSLTASVTYVPPPETSGGRGWASRFAPLAAALGVFALLVVAVPLFRILSAALVEESSSRARALVDLLAAANETALAEGRVQDASVDRVAAEPGVVGAYILTPTGEVLAPRDRAGQAPAIDGLSGGVADVRSFRESRDSNGDRILAQPVIHRGRRVGVAVLTHRSPAVGLPWVALLFGSLLLSIAVAGVVLLARRMTVSPLNDLRLEVDALGEGRGAALPIERPYSELSQLASSLNRVLAARQAISGVESMESRKPGAQDRH